MTGGFLFKITAKRVQYEFNVSRKIMRITGDSATGKSELIRVLGDAGNPKTGISINCKYKCEVITDVFFKYIKEDIIIISNTIKNHSSTEFYDAMRNLLKRYDDTLFFADDTMVIAAGAAFGCEIEGILGTISRNNLDIRLFLPESFEYLVLDSELFSNYGFSNGTANTVNVITGLYFSWERYFTAFLTQIKKNNKYILSL